MALYRSTGSRTEHGEWVAGHGPPSAVVQAAGSGVCLQYVEHRATTLGLTETELVRLSMRGLGQALWRIRERAVLVQHQLHDVEADLYDGTGRMRTASRKFSSSDGGAGRKSTAANN